MRPLRIAAAVFFVSSAAVLAQSEGVAEFKGTTHTEKDQTIPSQGKVYFSKSACRVEWETDLRQLREERKDAPKGMISDRFRMVLLTKLSEPDRVYHLNDERKTYSVTDLSKEKRDAKTPAHTWKVQKLGRDTVAGLSCEKALLTADDGVQTEVCVTKEVVPSRAWLSAWNRREEQRTPLLALKENGLDGFPVRWVFREKGKSEVSSSVELVRFERKSVPGSLLEIPPGYRQTSAASVWMSPEQEKALRDAKQKALENMTPEQRKKYEEYMKQQGLEPQR